MHPMKIPSSNFYIFQRNFYRFIFLQPILSPHIVNHCLQYLNLPYFTLSCPKIKTMLLFFARGAVKPNHQNMTIQTPQHCIQSSIQLLQPAVLNYKSHLNFTYHSCCIIKFWVAVYSSKLLCLLIQLQMICYKNAGKENHPSESGNRVRELLPLNVSFWKKMEMVGQIFFFSRTHLSEQLSNLVLNAVHTCEVNQPLSLWLRT